MLQILEFKVRAAEAGIEKIEMDRSGGLKVAFSMDKPPGKKEIAGIVDLFPGRLTFQTREGFGMALKGPRPGGGRPDAAVDLENLLKLLEFSGK
jgi:hypothetical protein